MPESLLEVRDLHAWYGESHILHGVEFEIRRGEMVTLLGRNGAGKTTTLKAIMGIVGRRRGSVVAAIFFYFFDGASPEVSICGLWACLTGQVFRLAKASYDLITKKCQHTESHQGTYDDYK